MAWPVLPHGFLGAQGSETDNYQIQRSLRFNSADSAYLNRTPASAGNRKTWTWSGWVKRSNLGTTQVFYSASETGSSSQLFFDTSDRINIFAGAASINVVSTPRYRDVSSWYHIVVSLDTTQATASDRVKLYVNGTQVTAFEGSTYYPSQNAEPNINNTVIHALGAQAASGSITAGTYLSSYLTEINFIDGQALTPSSFGETDAITGRWKAKAYSGTYGTNGFYLKFADNSGTTATTLGKDSSPNGNNWTPNNFSVTAGAGNDSLVDSPTNYGTDSGVGGEVRGNYATLNPLQKDSNITITNGNLSATSSGNYGIVGATFGISSGKWYWEITATGATLAAGIFNQGVDLSSYLGSNANGWAFETWSTFAQKRNNNSASSYGSTLSVNDIVGVKFDADNGTLEFLKNNVSLGTAYSGLTSGPYFPAIADPTTTANINCSVNFGQRPFAYTAPSGFKALCTTNLPTPTIQKPSKYMDVVTYTGNNSSRSITGLNFSPDLVWIKSRSAATWNFLFDAVRGATKWLASNQTGAEATNTTSLTSFDSGGFSLSTDPAPDTSTGWNANSATYVAWAWDEAPIAGMDIVSFTAPASGNTTVSHSLGVTPRMIIAKSRNSPASWTVYHASATTKDQYLFLDTTNAVQTLTDVWGSAAPTSSVFGFNSNNQGASASVIAYLFAEVEGFSKFGSYTGNGSADGPFVWCGFRPRWVMFKRTDSTSNWYVYDSSRGATNVISLELYPDGNFVETNGGDTIDFVSSGFKIRTNQAAKNTLNGTWIFAAFAESPFKYARAR